MTDVTPDSNGKGKESKRAIAKREWLNAAGERIPTGSPDVAGVRYTYLDTNNSVEYVLGQNEQLDRQFAAMGAVTKLGNVVNTVTTDEDYDGSDPIPVVIKWLSEASNGLWRESGDGVARGPKYDKDILAAVIVQVLGEKAAGTVLEYRQRLDEKSYYAKVRAKTKIMAAYAQELVKRGGAEATVDDIA